MPLVAVRFHRGRRKFAKYAAVMKEMTGVHNREIKPRFIRDFDRIVANWSNKPGFLSRLNQNPDGLKMYVFPTGSKKVKDIWKWNVFGTDPHDIEAKNAPRLAFIGNGIYLPKTGPGGTFYGGPGRTIGGALVRPLVVHHPGTDPRNWPEVIRKKNKTFYSRTIENAWRRALRKINSG